MSCACAHTHIHMHTHAHPYVLYEAGDQKVELEILEQELQIFVSYPIWVLGTQSRMPFTPAPPASTADTGI